jgi:hypothetical protein
VDAAKSKQFEESRTIINIIRNLMKVEKYIGIKNNDIQKYELKWIAFKNI